MPICPTRTVPKHSAGRIRIVRTPRTDPDPRPSRLVLQPLPPAPGLDVSPKPSGDQEPLSPRLLDADNSPAARARRTRRKLRRLFADASRTAQGQVRLCRTEEYQLLRCAYAAVQRWRDDGVAEEIERELRAEAQVAISRASGLFLVLLRSALPRLDGKRASKWAAALALADHHGVSSKRLVAFLRNHGGIEGAARMAAKLRASRDV